MDIYYNPDKLDIAGHIMQQNKVFTYDWYASITGANTRNNEKEQHDDDEEESTQQPLTQNNQIHQLSIYK